MQKQQSVVRPEIKLMGISVRTNNAVELGSLKGKIFPVVQRYFHGQLFNQIPNRARPGTTFCAYTNYESDHNGDYTYFIGEEVSSHQEVPNGFETLVIPAQTYTKFTTAPGGMPDVLTGAWKEILAMSPQELGGKRRYQTDFEIYDERASDHSRIVLDVFIGLTPSAI